MPSPLSKSALIESIAKLQTDNTSKRQVKSVVEALVTVGHRELSRRAASSSCLDSRNSSSSRSRRRRRERASILSPKSQPWFKAKPARKVVKARPVKAVKDAIA